METKKPEVKKLNVVIKVVNESKISPAMNAQSL